MPTYVCTAAQARSADRTAIAELHIPSLVLIENAARAIYSILRKKTAPLPAGLQSVSIFCGPGNNGADGLALARLFLLDGARVSVFLEADHLSPDAKRQYEILQALKESRPALSLSFFERDSQVQSGEHFKPAIRSMLCADTWVIDALLGTGLSRPLRSENARLIEALNALPLHTAAIDIPTGIHTDTGEKRGTAFRADLTIALDCLKWGLLLNDGARLAGEVVPVDIGIPSFLHETTGSARLVDEAFIRSLLPERTTLSHKGTFGKVLMIGGSAQMQGALAMAAKACFESGCGTLTLFTPRTAASAIRSKYDLAMVVAARQDEYGFFAREAGHDLGEVLDAYSMLAIGNGMGKGEGALGVLRTVLDAGKPCIYDADAIRLLGAHLDLQKHMRGIVTPHLGEFCSLVHASMDSVSKKPYVFAQYWASHHPDCVLTLKSDFTLVCCKDRSYVIDRPDSALAKGGSGDVLCGISTGLCASGLAALPAAIAAAWIHNQAARYATSAWSFTPEKLIDHLGDVFASLQGASA